MFISYINTVSFTALYPLLNYAVCGLWLSREGLVSREEITAYFMRASVICSKLGLGFVHNFQETTYMKPTFCDNCSGFVSHHTKTQGWRFMMKCRHLFYCSVTVYKFSNSVWSCSAFACWYSAMFFSIIFFTVVGCHQARLQMQR